MKEWIFTSESVSAGHPDKVCDQISDTLVDLFLSYDPQARTAIETIATTNRVILAGEIRTIAPIDKEKIEETVRNCIKKIGFAQPGFHWKKLKFDNYLHEQSPDIAQGVDAANGKDEGAGDQGIMFGYACNETQVFMPAPIYYSHRILQAIDEARIKGELPQIEPDGKSQVSVAYVNGKPTKTTSVLVSLQHNKDFPCNQIRHLIRPIVQNALPKGWMCSDENFYVNPTGRFVIGGPDGDAGLTGRKIIVDTYGGAAPHGGGAFSGKDPTKVDRSAAYMARFLAKNIVAAGLSDKCTIQLSYAIGLSKPMSIYVNLHNNNSDLVNKVLDFIKMNVDLSPKGIREYLQLNKPIYARTATYGHFGRTPDIDGGFSWEKLDLVDPLKKLL